MSVQQKNGELFRVPRVFYVPSDGTFIFPCPQTLLAGAGVRARRGARGFRYAQVARCGGLADFVDYQLDCLTSAAGVEENRLVDRPVLLLEALVIRQHVDGVLILLDV